ncbi:MAG: wax ester/triacylglycerol synthase family O-acyltransferase [Polyangiales bacterium]
MDRMGPLEASFLHLEGPTTPMHVGSVGIFEGPPPDYDELVAFIASRLPRVPKYRQKVMFVPGELARPVWVDDPHFRVEYHVRHTALPRPGSDAQLRENVGRIMSQMLDRTKPLWEMWVIEGLPDDQWAVISKVHHCMVDGISGADLLTVLFELSPEASPIVPAPKWEPRPLPTNLELLKEAATDLVHEPQVQLESLRRLYHDDHPMRDVLNDVAAGLKRAVELREPGHPSVLNGPIGAHRTWDFARVPLPEVKAAAKRCGGTVNDVVLAALTQGFRELLLAHGEKLDEGHVVHSLVPVSVRQAEERNQFNTKVAAMVASLPTGIDDAKERLRRVAAQMKELKESKETSAAHALTKLSGFAPPTLVAMFMHWAHGVVQSRVNTITTNVPGPQIPLYLRGRKMVAARPYVPLGVGIRLTVGIFSYDGNIDFGVTGDWDSMDHVDVLCRGVERSLVELCH